MKEGAVLSDLFEFHLKGYVMNVMRRDAPKRTGPFSGTIITINRIKI